MPVGAIIALVIVIVIIAAAAAVAGTLVLRVLGMRRQFGPEYQRLVREVGVRRTQAELADRQRRVARLGIRPLSAEQHASYSGEWKAAQEQFVDSPAQATEAAAELVRSAAADRGYKVDDHPQLLKDLSVNHARRLDGYRRAAQVTEQAALAATEELRQALLAHRALFRELLGAPPLPAAQPRPGAAIPAAAVPATPVPAAPTAPITRPLAAAHTIAPGSTGRAALPVSRSATGPMSAPATGPMRTSATGGTQASGAKTGKE
jgi:hypothetical protein